MTRYVLGVDGGGTKTDAVIADEHGKIISSASNGGANWERMGIDKALISLEEVICKAAEIAGIKTSQIESASFAIAGAMFSRCICSVKSDASLTGKVVPLLSMVSVRTSFVINTSACELW